MIVRDRREGPGVVLIEQHEHGLISGEFAHYWGWPPNPSGSALYAIAEHDLGWKELDAYPLWHPEKGRPYAFFEYPSEPRLAANRRGVDAVEAQDPYAGLLCSLAYEILVRDSTGVAEASFRAAEHERQSRLLFAISDEERERVDDELSLLRLCDNLSLFVCLNEPGENAFPWFREGFLYGDTRLIPVWEASHTLRLDPNPFTEGFVVRIPYGVVDEFGQGLGEGVTEIEVST